MISGKLGLATLLQKINLTHPTSALKMMSRQWISSEVSEDDF